MSSKKKSEDNIVQLLRICTFLLAVVSFWATASGMAEYTFAEKWQAYAASLGIQGLLLGLNFSLPSFLRKCKDNKKQKFTLYALTSVVLFCSSWFSYLFIAGQVYGDSWSTESRLLAQSAYRKELFAADEYTEQYGDELEQVLAEQVGELYNQAQNMDKQSQDVADNLDWNEEREIYAAEGSSTRTIMLTAIDAIERAAGSNVGQDIRTNSVSILSDLQANVQAEIERLNSQIVTAAESVVSAETSLNNAQNRLNNAPSDVDLTSYQNAVNRAAQNFERSVTRQLELEQRRDDYQNALQRISYYGLTLGMAQEGVSNYFVGANLREIQKELFTSEPDYERMQELAAEVFDRLQSSVELGSDINDGSEYQNFLSSMNRFVKNLDNYRLIKESNNELQNTIAELADGSILNINNEFDETYLEDAVNPVNYLITQFVRPILNSNDKDALWQSEWLTQFNDLKARISGLPVYTLAGQIQINVNSITSSFDRNDSVSRLDKAIRNYLTKHNAAQQGLIYLLSPYFGVALFSLFLAFLLDIAAFVTGVMIDRTENDKSNKKTDNENSEDNAQKTEENSGDERNDEDEWFSRFWRNVNAKNINNGNKNLPKLVHYAFFTGDYNYVNGVKKYKTIENGQENEVEYTDSNLTSGIYMLFNKKYILPTAQKLLLGFETDGPQDGVMENCLLSYENGFLINKQGGVTKSIVPVDLDIAVYRLSNKQYDIIDVNKVKDIICKKAIIALSKDGTKVVAIYLVLDDNEKKY